MMMMMATTTTTMTTTKTTTMTMTMVVVVVMMMIMMMIDDRNPTQALISNHFQRPTMLSGISCMHVPVLESMPYVSFFIPPGKKNINTRSKC